MKNRIFGGIGLVLTGVLLAVGPHTIFKICDQSHHQAGASNCFWTSQALLGIGLVFALLGLVYMAFKSASVRAGLSLSAAGNMLLTFLTANVFIGMDADAMMACRVTTLPAVNTIAVIGFILTAVNTIYLLRQGGAKGVTGNAGNQADYAVAGA